MKLALHRSIIFWSGLLVMAFVCWAWRDSTYRLAGVAYGDTVLLAVNRGISVRHLHQQNSPLRATCEINPFPHPEWAICQPVFLLRGEDQQLNTIEEYERHEKQLQMVANARDLYRLVMRVELSRSSLLYIPYWIILLAVAVLWLGLLFWRARWRKRAAIS